ncbi:hypothetical protein L1887_38812 [Cichorium endivia]|nr:hypothetical protein L1887_38812 [Cichorium endivia]
MSMICTSCEAGNSTRNESKRFRLKLILFHGSLVDHENKELHKKLNFLLQEHAELQQKLMNCIAIIMGCMEILPPLVEGGSDGAGAGGADGGRSRSRLKENCEHMSDNNSSFTPWLKEVTQLTCLSAKKWKYAKEGNLANCRFND